MILTSKRHAEHPFAGQNTQKKTIQLQDLDLDFIVVLSFFCKLCLKPSVLSI